MAWYQVNLAYFTGRLQFRVQAVMVGVYSVARVVLAVGLVLAGLAIHGVVLGITLAALLVGVLTHIGVRRDRSVGAEGMPAPEWRQLVAFSLPLVAVSFGISALLNLDLLLFGQFAVRVNVRWSLMGGPGFVVNDGLALDWLTGLAIGIRGRGGLSGLLIGRVSIRIRHGSTPWSLRVKTSPGPGRPSQRHHAVELQLFSGD